MTTIAQPEIPSRVVGGVDTHKDQHVAAALDHIGRLLGIAEFPATRAGYQQLHAWLASHVRSALLASRAAGRGARVSPATWPASTSSWWR